MFKVPLFDFSYDWEYLAKAENHKIKNIVDEIYQFLKHDFLTDFELVTELEDEQFAKMRSHLASENNINSVLVYHLISFFQLNPRRSNKEDENSLLHFLCACGRLEDVKWLLGKYPKLKVNVNNHIFQTPIQFAVAVGDSPEIAAYLISMGAQVNCSYDGDQAAYSLADALFQRWIKSESSVQFLHQWREILEDYNVLNDIEEKYTNMFNAVLEHQWDSLVKRQKV